MSKKPIVGKRVLLIPDTHIPYHDKRAYGVMLKAAKDFNPDMVIILGDFIDNYSISRYDKDPKRDRFLKWEVSETNKALDKLDSLFPKAEKIFIAGNHEERLDSYIKDKAPELFGLVDTPILLRLKQRKWKYLSYGKHYRIGKLIATHGTITRKGVARAMTEKYGHSVVFGHVHKIEQSVKVNALGECHVGFTPGWLGNIKKADYIKDFTDWMLGFATAVILPSGNFFHQIHPIVGYKCYLNNTVYEG